MMTIDQWQQFAWGRGYLQASREVPQSPMSEPDLSQLALGEGWLEAQGSEGTAQQVGINQAELARLFAERWKQGYQERFAQDTEQKIGNEQYS